MPRNWTPEQKTAIEARNGSLLLSAAAGSGKTAVLVERVIQRLTDPNNPCTPDELLIVTFTKAAAAEMKQKIISAVSSLALKNPQRPELFKLQVQMQSANICTMDSFCAKLIRENSAILGIESDFRVGDSSELNLMRNSAMSITLDVLHDNENKDLLPLIEMFATSGDYGLLRKSIERLYDNSCTYPFPDLWLQEIEDMYFREKNLSESLWGQIISEKILSLLDYAATLTEDAGTLLENNKDTEQELYKKIYPNIEQLNYNISAFKELLEEKDWDGMLEFAKDFNFGNMRPGPKSPLKDHVGKKHNEAVKQLKKIPELLCATENEHKEDIELLRPIVKGLVYAVKVFTENFKKLKAEANVLDFSDNLHYALNLLYIIEDGVIKRTDFAKELSNQFVEVLIDEYQDTNQAQDMLFRGLSKNEENLFMVGDVKQSIYRFRHADPSIFMSHSDKLELYKDENYPSKIFLSKNFRSRWGILSAVNFIFTQIMSRQTGNVHYNELEKLYCGRKDTKSDIADTEIHFLDFEKDEDEEEKAVEAEVRHIAYIIKNMVQEQRIITGKDGKKRPVRYGDFCILLRSAASVIDIFSNILSEYDIPVQNENNRNFFESREIANFLSLLKVIDNPLSDVELLSLMLSPIYGFTADELATLRIKDRKASIYELLSAEKSLGNKKVISLLDDLQRYNSISSFGGAADFIRKLISKTKYMGIISAMSESEKRKANINLLISFAEDYDSRSTGGLSGFLRYFDKLQRTDKEQDDNKKLESASLGAGSSNSVNIMTIHKSKGLEFPIVILAGTSKYFNKQDISNRLLIHSKLGIGIQIQKPEEFKKYSSIAHEAIKSKMRDEAKSEEIRILYVALTRARERLIVLATRENMNTKIDNIASLATFEGEKISPYFILEQNDFCSWLLLTCLRHPSAGGVLREQSAASNFLPENFILENSPPIDISLSSPQEYTAPESEVQELHSQEELENHTKEKEAILSLINERMSYEYPYKALQSLSTKYAASSLAKAAEKGKMYTHSKPEFLRTSIDSGSEIGTAVHTFLQYCDFSNAAKDVQAEIERLQTEKKLSPQQAKVIQRDKINALFKSPLFLRVMKSEQIYREKRFSISIDACEIEPNLPPAVANEQIFIQGVADLIFIEDGECVILDYKTDNVKNVDELQLLYKDQLHIYKMAAEKVFGMKVKEVFIYSLSLNKEISIDFMK